MLLDVNYILPQSKVQGPGTRFTIWVQGCSIHCQSCSNKDTWEFGKGTKKDVDLLVEEIDAESGVDGVTVTGGEPLDQFNAVLQLCKKLFRRKGRSLFLTTGYTLNQMVTAGKMEILSHLDMLCTGPFMESKICKGEWRGSSNQEMLYLTARGKAESTYPVFMKEIYVDGKGDSMTTGFTV